VGFDSQGAHYRIPGQNHDLSGSSPSACREAKASVAKLETEVVTGTVSFDDLALADLLDRCLEQITRVGRGPTTTLHEL
jgi:hypothetical protein